MWQTRPTILFNCRLGRPRFKFYDDSFSDKSSPFWLKCSPIFKLRVYAQGVHILQIGGESSKNKIVWQQRRGSTTTKKYKTKKKIINEEMPKTQGDHNAERGWCSEWVFLTLPSKQLFLNLHCPSTPASAWLIEDGEEKEWREGKKKKKGKLAVRVWGVLTNIQAHSCESLI